MKCEQARIHKIISNSGVLSRRKAEQAIREGRVELNGKTVINLGSTSSDTNDRILLDGEPIRRLCKTQVVLFHKPKNVIASRRDPEGRPTVMDYLPKHLNVYPAGRLDFDSEGLLIFTNDGEITQRLLHPKYEIQREYAVEVRGPRVAESIARLTRRIRLEDGWVKVDKVNLQKIVPETDWQRGFVVVALHVGRNRVVRRLFEAIGLEVVRLLRTRIGPFELGHLRSGAHELLNQRDTEQCRRKIGL